MEHNMVLLNKDHPVLELLYDDELHAFIKILDIHELDYAPPAILNTKGMPDRRTLNEWWRGRAIPASRNHLADDFPYLDDTRSLAEQSMGLSLSDRYWIRSGKNRDLKYKDVNFFDNPFTDDLGLITLGQKQQSHDGSENMYSPNATLGGDLRKKWTIQNNIRILLKSGSGLFRQEPYNEVVATALHKRLLKPDEYVAYTLQGAHSACPNMLGEDEELVPMWDLIANHKKPNHLNDFSFCLELCSGHGIPEEKAYGHFEKMFTCDFILANHDRHYRNFGLIRNVETLAYTRMAPVYDTGSCLWHDKDALGKPVDYAYTAKPFGQNGMQPENQMGLFKDFQWFDESRLRGFAEEASEILKRNPLMTKQRRDNVLKGLEQNLKYAIGHISDIRQQKSRGGPSHFIAKKGRGDIYMAEQPDKSVNVSLQNLQTY